MLDGALSYCVARQLPTSPNYRWPVSVSIVHMLLFVSVLLFGVRKEVKLSHVLYSR